MPARPPGRQRTFGDRAELAGRGELAVGGAQDPHVFRGQGKLRREPPAVLGEEQDRVRGRHDFQLGHVIPAGQRDLDGAHRPGQRVHGLRAGPHRDGIAVGGHLPGGDLTGRRQDNLHACPAGSKADARARRAAARGGRGSPCRGLAEALRADLFARRVGEAVREADAVQVRLGAGQAVE